MTPLTPAEWVALIGAVAAAFAIVVKAASDAERTRAEVAAMRADLNRDRQQDAERRNANDQLLRETHHQVTPNGGGSIKDSTTRLEAAVGELRGMQADQLQRLDRLEESQRVASSDVRGIRRDIGRLADSDIERSARAENEHGRIWDRLNDITSDNNTPGRNPE